MGKAFVDTINEMPFMEEEFDFDAEVADLEDRGFAPWPIDYVPAPLPGYEYEWVGMLEPYSKPACRVRHHIRYWLRRWWRMVMRPVSRMERFVKLLEDDEIPF